jgi:hypothetical protein
VVVLGQELETAQEVVPQETLGHIEALDLLHGLELLLPLDPGVLKGLVLLLDAVDFLLDLGLPLSVLDLSALVVLELELPDLLELVVLLHLQTGLLDGLVEQHVQNGLHLDVVLE